MKLTRAHAEFIARVLLVNKSPELSWYDLCRAFVNELKTSEAQITPEEFLKQCGYD